MNLIVLAIDMVLVFLVFSVFVSGIQEWLAQKFANRGAFLREGLTRLIDNQDIVDAVFAHPLIAGTSRAVGSSTSKTDKSTGDAATAASATGAGSVAATTSATTTAMAAKARNTTKARVGTLPSYIDEINFSLALCDVLINMPKHDSAPGAAPLTIDALRNALGQRAPSDPIVHALLPIIDSANGNLQAALAGIQDWFSRDMDRVSGWYKAHAQWRVFFIGLAVAVLANVNSIAIFQALNRSPAYAAQLADSAGTVMKAVSTSLEPAFSASTDGGSVGPTQSGPSDQASPASDSGSRIKAVVVRVEVAASGKDDVGSSSTSPSGVARLVQDTPLSQLPIGYACLAPAKNQDAGNSANQVASAEAAVASCRADFGAFVDTGPMNWLAYLFGCALTALAGTLGAPYWFAALADLLKIRGSGPTPASRKADNPT